MVLSSLRSIVMVLFSILYLTGMYIARYRVEVMVTQNNESSKFLLWDHECAELNDQTADEVKRVKIEVCSCLIIYCFLFYVLYFVLSIVTGGWWICPRIEHSCKKL